MSEGFSFNRDDITPEQQALVRRRKLIDAMAAQNMGAPITGGNGFAQALAKLGTTWLLKGAGDNAEAEARNLDAQRRASLGPEIERYFQTREGTPEQPIGGTEVQQALLEANSMSKMTPAQPGNPRRAMVEALSSNNPELQTLGRLELQNLAKQKQNPEFAYHIAPNGDLIRTDKTGAVPPSVTGNYAKPDDKYVDEVIQGPNGPILVARNTRTNKPDAVDKAPKTNVNVDTKGELAALQALGKDVPKVLSGARESVINAQKAFDDAQTIMALASDPATITGFAAGPAGGLAALGVKLGFVGPEAATQTQALMAQIARQTLDASKDLKGAISDKEKPFLEMAAAGKIDWTADTLKHLAGLSIAGNANTIMNATDQYERTIRNVPGAGAGRDMYPMPPVNFKIPEQGFQIDPTSSRVRYTGILPGAPAPAGSTPAAPSGFRIRSVREK